MVNIPKLKGIIAEKDIKQTDLCVLWGCKTRQTVSGKVNGKIPISLDEAQRFSEFANLTDEEKVNIFLSEG